MRHGALKTVLTPGAHEVELGQAFERLARDGKPHIEALITQIAGLTLRHSFETEAVTFSERKAGVLPGAQEVSVAFADVVGFTRLGEELLPEELSGVVDALSSITHDVVGDPVRLVKTIGDAVMLVSPDPVKLVFATVNLVEEAEHRHLRLRAGIAPGPAISRGGDWYGSAVNLASRITHAAPPGGVWVAEITRAAVSDAASIAFAPAGTRQLRGVRGTTTLYRVMRGTAAQPPPAGLRQDMHRDEIADYVVIGAGSAGSMLAGRLSAAGASVILLESGGTDRRPDVMPPLGIAVLYARAN